MRRKKTPDNAIMLLLYIILLIPVGIVILVRWIIKEISSFCKGKDIDVSNANIDAMDGLQFESFIANLVRENGYKNVKITKASGDYGVDVLAEKNGQVYAIQCKRYSEKLGIKPVQEVYAGAQMYNADICVVATNSYFTTAAKHLAEQTGVILWDRASLNKMRAFNLAEPPKGRTPLDKRPL